jgi:hypothetical protein
MDQCEEREKRDVEGNEKRLGKKEEKTVGTRSALLWYAASVPPLPVHSSNSASASRKRIRDLVLFFEIARSLLPLTLNFPLLDLVLLARQDEGALCLVTVHGRV